MSLLHPDEFASIFAPLQKLKIGFFPYTENVDYHLTNSATQQLLFDYQINYRVIKKQEIIRGECYQPLDIILISGGEYLNKSDPRTLRYLRDAFILGVPVTVLPQSIHNPNLDLSIYKNLFVRENNSVKHFPNAGLTPELSLALRPPWVDEGIEVKTGVWLRDDNEGRVEDPGLSLGDPVHISWNNNDYFGLASKFEHIITDRLQFAIAALLINRRVTLLPNASKSNRAIYDSWLKDLGCKWRNGLNGIKTDPDEVNKRLWKRLAAPPSALVAWNSKPVVDGRWQLQQSPGVTSLHHDNDTVVNLNSVALTVWSLCDGESTVEDICQALSEHFNQPLKNIAKDVQNILFHFRKQGVTRIIESIGTAPAKSSSPAADRRFIEVDIHPPVKRKGRIIWSANVRGSSKGDFLHYFDVDARWRSALTKRADPFLLALLPLAMFENTDLRIQGGSVDSKLLDHLDEYQHAWNSLRPEHSHLISIQVDETSVSSRHQRPAISAFSGGLDSMHTLCRHKVVHDGRRNRNIEAVVMACGFDIPVNDRAGFKAALDRLLPVTEEAGVELIDVYTNIRTYTPSWVQDHAAALASVLCLFTGKFGSGLISSTFPYPLFYPWGSNPVTDHLLGGAFEIEHDSAGLFRFDKLRSIANWPIALKSLRVCWENRDSSKNCGRCEKCMHLVMGLQTLDAPMDCFDENPDDVRLAKYAATLPLTGLERDEFSGMLEHAKQSNLQAPWFKVFSKRLVKK